MYINSLRNDIWFHFHSKHVPRQWQWQMKCRHISALLQLLSSDKICTRNFCNTIEDLFKWKGIDVIDLTRICCTFVYKAWVVRFYDDIPILWWKMTSKQSSRIFIWNIDFFFVRSPFICVEKNQWPGKCLSDSPPFFYFCSYFFPSSQWSSSSA